MRPFPQRASHARSCALLVAEKYRVTRESIIDRVREEAGVNLNEPKSARELIEALPVIETLKKHGLGREMTKGAMPPRKPDEISSARVRVKSFNGTVFGPPDLTPSENYWLLIGREGVVIAPKNERDRVLVEFSESITALGLHCHNSIPNTLFLLESDLVFVG